MGFLDSIKSWLRTEAAEAQDIGAKAKGRIEADLDRREAELNLAPEERLERLQEQIEDNSGFEAIQDKIEGRGALADASSEISDLDRATRESADEVLDLESEEVIPPDPDPGSTDPSA